MDVLEGMAVYTLTNLLTSLRIHTQSLCRVEAIVPTEPCVDSLSLPA